MFLLKNALVCEHMNCHWLESQVDIVNDEWCRFYFYEMNEKRVFFKFIFDNWIILIIWYRVNERKCLFRVNWLFSRIKSSLRWMFENESVNIWEGLLDNLIKMIYEDWIEDFKRELFSLDW